MSSTANRKLKWGAALVLIGLVLLPLEFLFYWDTQRDVAYWCAEAHFSTVRCHAAEGASSATLWTMTVLATAVLVGIGMLLDQLILGGTAHAHDASS